MAETRNWLEMPHEIMGPMILQRIGALEILKSAQKVCTTWRRICKNPAMWKVISINHSSDAGDTDSDVEKLIKQAVHRSCGELIDISLEFNGITDQLLDYISRCSSKLNHLRVMNGICITGCGLSNALKRLPLLETLELSFISICAKDIEVIGSNCPQLKSFGMLKCSIDFDGFAHAIAHNMPALCHLQLGGFTTVKDNEIRAILNRCSHLESLDLSGCAFSSLDSNLKKLCREPIKDFKCKRNNIVTGYEASGIGFHNYDDIYDDSYDYDYLSDNGFINFFI